MELFSCPSHFLIPPSCQQTVLSPTLVTRTTWTTQFCGQKIHPPYNEDSHSLMKVGIDSYREILSQNGYQGFLAFEGDMPHPDYEGQEEKMIAESIRYLKEVASELK